MHSGTRFVYDGRFPGQRFDASTGSLHNGFRTYSPKLGRYIQSDPLGLVAGWNTYAYVEGNPVNGLDPLGLTVVYGGPYGGKMKNILEAAKRRSSHLRNLMTVLELSDRTYHFNSAQFDKNDYNSITNTLHWNKDLQPQCISLSPSEWVVGKPWLTLYPIEGLVHEIGHAYRDEMRNKLGIYTPDKSVEESENLIHEQIIINQLSNGRRRGRGSVEYYLGD